MCFSDEGSYFKPCLIPRPAPSSVRGLQVASSSSDSLSVSWQVGLGRAERFRVLLTDQDGVLLKNVSLLNTATSAQLDSLRPGSMYTVTVVTEAVGLQSFASRLAVTGRYYGMYPGTTEFHFSLVRGDGCHRLSQCLSALVSFHFIMFTLIFIKTKKMQTDKQITCLLVLIVSSMLPGHQVTSSYSALGHH